MIAEVKHIEELDACFQRAAITTRTHEYAICWIVATTRRSMQIVWYSGGSKMLAGLDRREIVSLQRMK